MSVDGGATPPAFTWTPATANPAYRIGLWVRSNGSTSDAPEASWSADFPITEATGSLIYIDTIAAPVAPAPALPIAGVTISTDRVAPQLAGTTIVATATVSGGSSTLQYQWLIHDGVSWTSMTGWTTSKTYSWTPTSPNAGHFIGVWVRNAANTNGDAEATASVPFPIQ